ncbi:MAG: hypothetical protein GY861_04115 [bacterium]|nr:hypothetical protein [bacterium]
MNKEELLQELSNKVSVGEISRGEIMASIGAPADEKEDSSVLAHFSVTKMFYVIGAAIVVIGIVIFAAQIWDDIGSAMRVVITLGLGLLFAALGSVLLKQRPGNGIGPIFHFIGGVLIPGGAAVALVEADITSEWMIAVTYCVIFLFYLLLNFVQKHAVLTFFAIANGTAAIYLITNAIIGGPFGRREDMYEYLTMAMGASYLLLAHSFRIGWNKILIGVLHVFGSAFILGAAFAQVFDSVVWQILYFLLVLGGLFLSVYMRSRSVLAISTIFLIVHISYITGKYFADSLGWPISLVLLGFVFIGLGYVSIRISKKYIGRTE